MTPDFPPGHGGIQLVMHRLVESWTKVDAQVVTLNRRGAEAFDAANAVRIRRVPRRGNAAARAAALNAAALRSAASLRPDVVLSGHIVTSPAGWLGRRLFGTPYVQYVYGVEVANRASLAHFAIRNSAAVVAISSYTESLAQATGASPARVHRIPVGVDGFERFPSGKFDAPTVVTLSRLDDWYKGQDVLIRALPLVRAQVPDARLVIVGDGALRPFYEGVARSLGIAEHVDFAGALDDEARDRVLVRAHVFAMPSRLTATGGGEGFGIAYLEAGARGLPVVAGNVGGAVDAVVDGVTGVLVDPTDHVAVATAIAELLRDPAKAEALGRAGAERAKEFAWPKIAARVEQLLLAVAHERA